MKKLSVRTVVVCLAAATLSTACSKTSSNANEGAGGAGPTPLPSRNAPATIDGQLFDAFSGGGISDVVIASSAGSTLSDAGGHFQLTTTAGDSVDARLSRGGYIDRETTLRAGDGAARLSMIRDDFDLRTFDEMFRAPQLQRWTTTPVLLVEGTTLRFAGFDRSDAEATSGRVSDSEMGSLIDDLRWGLSTLTGGHYSDFASVQRQQSAAGAQVGVLNPGVITVALYQGLTATTGYWGYGRTLVQSDGTIVGGSIMIDRDFNASGSPRRRALRVHELGHALGANHVTLRASVMNAQVSTEPTAYDRTAGLLAYQRAAGNRYPDVDPSGSRINAAHSARWSAGVQ